MAAPWDSLSDLVIVAAHAVLRPWQIDRVLHDDAWVLQPFQRAEPPLYVEHVRAAVHEAASRPGSLLVFSGGQTRQQGGPFSEAQSYFLVAEHFDWWSHHDVRVRVTTEEFARDSFENLLFAICRFRECSGALPQRVVVMGWEFKRARFELHRRAIGFPASRWEYRGVNDPDDVQSAMAGELRLGVEPFTADPMGVGETLSAKRQARNPFRRQPGYLESCPELRDLLLAKAPLAKGALPW